MKGTLHWVKGNKLRLAIPLREYITRNGETVVIDYEPPQGSTLSVVLIGSFHRHVFSDIIQEGNVLNVEDNGTLEPDVYAIEVKVTESGGTKHRDMWKNALEVTCEGTKSVEDFSTLVGEGSVMLDAALFYGEASDAAWSAAAEARAARDAALNAADIAQGKGQTAENQGQYAKNKGDYAKNMGDYAKNMGDHPAYIADGTQGKPGDIGFWYLWDYDTQAYVKGSRAKGDDIDYSTMTEGEKEELSLKVLQKVVNDNILGPTYDEDNRCVVFPVSSRVTYDASNRCVIFG